MHDIILQETYAEWLVPLAIVTIWILRWQLLLLFQPVQVNEKMSHSIDMDIFKKPIHLVQKPLPFLWNYMILIRRKESPEDVDENHHLSII